MMNNKNLVTALQVLLSCALTILVLLILTGRACGYQLPFLPPQKTVSCFKDCKTDSPGYNLIENFEGYRAFVYKDAVGIPTIGFGHVVRPGEQFRQPLMGPDALMLLKKDVAGTERAVNRLVQVELLTTQYDALMSFSYNLGTGTLHHSTLLKKVNSAEHPEVPAQFMRYVNAGSPPHQLPGLIARRHKEAVLYAQ